jgi:steroid 5-alpha reductase family enzyme
MLIRQIFSVFALAMLALLVSRVYAGVWTETNWIMFSTAALVCLLVFGVFVYIFNFSYALACIMNGSLIAVALPTAPAFLLGGLMVIYGLRLGAFSWTRTRSDSYAQRSASTRAADQHMPTPIKAALWLQCTLLYTFHLFAIYLAAAKGELSTSVIVAAGIILAGILIEGLSDAQKQRAKMVERDNYVATGWFSRWRHPNYFGEILVQIGLIVAGVGAIDAGWANYLAVTVAPLYIILLMLSECMRADKSLLKRYQDKEGFAEYWARSGSLLPKL